MKLLYLTDNDPSFRAVWAWAKKLVTDLNSSASALQSSGSGVPPGALMGWGGATAPGGWLICDGSTYNRDDYYDLYTALGYTSGATFTVPDYRNRIFMGAGSIVALGEVAGAETVTLSISNMPVHDHAITDPGHTHTVTDPGHTHTVTDPGHVHSNGATASSIGTAGAAPGTATIGNTGSASTGVSVNSANTGVSNNSSGTGITMAPTGGGEAVNILPPIIGQHIIIKV